MKLGGKNSGPAESRLAPFGETLKRWLRAAGQRWSIWLGILAVASLGGGLWFYVQSRRPMPRVIEPFHPAQLEPQLREYVDHAAAWVRQKPHSADRHKTLGLVYLANGLWPEAALAFSNVASLNPKEPLAPLYWAAAVQEQGDLAAAAALLRRVTTRFPNFAPGYGRLGEVALRTGAVDEAERAYRQLLALAPTEPRASLGLGDVHLRQGRHREAVESLEKAIALDPELKGAHNLLGLAYRALGRMEEAQLELALGANPVSYPMPDAWSTLAPQHMRLLQDQIELANVLGQSGEADKAVRLLEAALRYHRTNLTLLNNLAIAWNRASKAEKALPVLEQALELNPDYLPAHVTRSFSLEALQRHSDALASAERALQLSPQTTQAHLAKANALLGMERDQDALTALAAAARSDPKNGEIHLEMGDVLWRNLQDPEAAFQHYQSATNLTPTLTPAHVRIADYHLRRGDTNAAQATLIVLRRLAPKNPDVFLLEDRWRRSIRSN